MDAKIDKQKAKPLSLRDAPSLIERIWPAQKISVEVQKERKAVQGQTITTLGTYWKGRKPLILVRACVLGALLPATGDDKRDLRLFELLMGMADDQIIDRLDSIISNEDVKTFASEHDKEIFFDADADLTRDEKLRFSAAVIGRMPYLERVDRLKRPEEVDDGGFVDAYLAEVNKALGTTATTLQSLVSELGYLRFGHTAKVADTFSGGGSIPFEAARLGCESFGSDLNPIACMLSWGAINLVGADSATREAIEKAQDAVVNGVEAEILKMGIETDAKGNRAKAYLYCLETRCPQTDWLIPISSTWVISLKRKIVAKLVPVKAEKRFDIVLKSNATEKEMKTAAAGSIADGSIFYTIEGKEYHTSIKTIRGDFRLPDGTSGNRLRRWEKLDFVPRPTDIFRERLYCIQWITKKTVNLKRQETFFAAPRDEDLKTEAKVEKIVKTNLDRWQADGLVPDMPIEPGQKTDEPIRTRGWTYWHHMFSARQLLMFATTRRLVDAQKGIGKAAVLIGFAKALDWGNRNCRFGTGAARESISNLFSNQALNTLYNFGVRSSWGMMDHIKLDFGNPPAKALVGEIVSQSAPKLEKDFDIFITDPPYADAVVYHEITEFFIAWLRKNPPPPFDQWIWDSRRPLAIKGGGEDFRRGMVESYAAMSNHMADNGLQIVMFTHQSSSVWADMAQIFWGAGLQVMAAWYIATETSSELKKGGYVQGTVILVLRKRQSNESGYKDEIVQEVKVEVADQISTMVGLNQSLKGDGRIENLFEDADLQMAGYAAALRVLTKYGKIDGVDMSKEALRERRAGDRNLVGDIIDFAVQVANEHMVPEYMSPKIWEGLTGAERFYFKMMDIETTSLRKLDNYQNFAKAFRVVDYNSMMGNMAPNKARLKTAKEFKKAGFEIPEFGPSATRAALYAIFELENDVEGDDVLSHLKDMLPNYHNKRDDLAAIADYVAKKREAGDETESRAARILHGLIRNERLG